MRIGYAATIANDLDRDEEAASSLLGSPSAMPGCGQRASSTTITCAAFGAAHLAQPTIRTDNVRPYHVKRR